MADEDVEVKFGASLEGLVAGIGEAKEALEGVTEPIAGLMEAFAGLGEALAAALAFEKIAEFAEHMGELGEETERTSKILGISTEEVGKLQYAAAMTGTPIDSLTTMMGRFEAGLAGAEKGTGRVAAGLQSLGLSAKELEGEDPSKQLERIAEAVSRFADGPAKTAAVQDLGRGFVQLIPLLDEGKEGFDELSKGAETAGVALSEGLTAQLVDMQHAAVNLKETITGLSIDAFQPFIGVVNGATAIVTDLINDFRGAGQFADVFKGGLDLISWGLKQVEQFIGETILGFKDFDTIGDTTTRALIEAFRTFGEVVKDVFVALVGGVLAFFTGLVTAGKEAVEAVGKQFVDLGTGINDTLRMNFAGAKAAFGQMGDDAETSAAHITGAFKGVFDFSQASNDAKAGSDRIGAILDEGDKKILANAKEGQREYDRIWGEVSAPKEGDQPKPKNPMPVEKDGSEAKEAAKLAEAQAQAEVDAAKRSETETQTALDNKLKEHGISMDEWLKQSLHAYDLEADAVQDAYDKELEDANLTSAQRVEIANREANALGEIAKKEADAQAKAAEEAQKSWKSFADTTSELVNNQLDGVLRGTTSIAQAFKNMAASAIEDILKYCVKWTAEHAAAVAANIAGLTAQTAAQSASSADGIAAILAQKAAAVAADIGTAAAGVAAFLAPLIGPAAIPAGAAAGAAVGGIGMADIGAYDIPSDQLMFVHKNELIMPAAESAAFRDLLSSGNGGAGGGKGVSIAPTTHFHVNAVDGPGVAQFLRNNQSGMMRAINDAVRQGAHLGLRRLATT